MTPGSGTLAFMKDAQLPEPTPRAEATNSRHIAGGSGAFGDVDFAFTQAIRRADDTVIVAVACERGPSQLVSLFEEALKAGVAQLCLGSTICRARAIDSDFHLRALVFELHHAGGDDADRPRCTPPGVEAAPLAA
jgi:hypothetical protein